MMTLSLPAAFLALALVGCATTIREVKIVTEPTEASIRVDRELKGFAPFDAVLDFSTKKAYVISASKEGFRSEEVTLTLDAPECRDERGVLRIALEPDTLWINTTESEATNRWLRIPVDSGIPQDSVWTKLLDSVTSRYKTIEQLDYHSGYLRSAVEVRQFRTREPSEEALVRTHLVGMFSEREPLVYKVMVVSEISRFPGVWSNFDRVFKDDLRLVEELQGRLLEKGPRRTVGPGNSGTREERSLVPLDRFTYEDSNFSLRLTDAYQGPGGEVRLTVELTNRRPSPTWYGTYWGDSARLVDNLGNTASAVSTTLAAGGKRQVFPVGHPVAWSIRFSPIPNGASSIQVTFDLMRTDEPGASGWDRAHVEWINIRLDAGAP